MTDPIPAWPGETRRRSLRARSTCGQRRPMRRGAEPALFVHGLGGSATNWTDLMDSAAPARGRRVAAGPPALACEAIDLPGFGFSPVPPMATTRSTPRPRAVIELIEHRRHWPVHLIGNSLGGAVCTRVAGRRPDLVRTLTLISPALPDLRPRLHSAAGVGDLRPGSRPLGDAPGCGRTTGRVQDPRHRPGRLPGSGPDASARGMPRRPTRCAAGTGSSYSHQVLIGSARGLVVEYLRRGPQSLWRDAARVTAPTLVLYGSHDRLVSPLMAARAARAFRCRAGAWCCPGWGTSR